MRDLVGSAPRLPEDKGGEVDAAGAGKSTRSARHDTPARSDIWP